MEKSKALIFGAYGNFGKLISRSLLRSGIPVILAGRNPVELAKWHETLKKQFPSLSIQTQKKDINEDMVQFLQRSKPRVLINTCGPFQTANYKIVENCISTRTDYVDLADGREFVTGMKKYHQDALKNGTTIITGASSVPALSSAVIESVKGQFEKIDKLRYGFSPGQKTTRGGLATVKGVMGYIGKPIKPFGNLTQPIYGWQDTYTVEYPSGLGTRTFGNCDIPDLDLFPQIYGIQDLRFSAGMESKILHRLIELTSWLIRLGLPLNINNYASILLKFSHWGFDWMGTDEGGMHMIFTGTAKDGSKIQRKWYLVVKKGQGPNVPAIPSIILGTKICLNQLSLPGVHPCVGLVTLDQYLDGLKDFDMQTFTSVRTLP